MNNPQSQESSDSLYNIPTVSQDNIQGVTLEDVGTTNHIGVLFHYATDPAGLPRTVYVLELSLAREFCDQLTEVLSFWPPTNY